MDRPRPTGTLSERERRVLADLAARTAAADPSFAARLGAGGAPRPGRAAVAALAAFVGGAALMLATFRSSPWVAFAGAALMYLAVSSHAGLLAAGARRLVAAARRLCAEAADERDHDEDPW